MQEQNRKGKTIWNMTPSGGFGMTLEVPVTVLSRTEQFATILIEKTKEQKTVPLSSLKL